MGALDDVPRLTRGPGSPALPARTIGLLGDIHAESERLAVAIRTLRDAGVERLLSVGDVCDGNGDLGTTIALLEANDVIAVSGNHERWMLRNEMRDLDGAHTLARESEAAARFLRLCPPMLEIATVAGTALLCHGVGRDDMAVIDPDTLDYWALEHRALRELLAAERFAWMLAGHTHRFMLRRFEHLGIVNAGTLSKRAVERRQEACFVRIDFERREVEHWTFFEGDAELSGRTAAPLP